MFLWVSPSIRYLPESLKRKCTAGLYLRLFLRIHEQDSSEGGFSSLLVEAKVAGHLQGPCLGCRAGTPETYRAVLIGLITCHCHHLIQPDEPSSDHRSHELTKC